MSDLCTKRWGMRLPSPSTSGMPFMCVYPTAKMKEEKNAKKNDFFVQRCPMCGSQKRPRVVKCRVGASTAYDVYFRINISFCQNLIFNELALVHRKQFSLSRSLNISRCNILMGFVVVTLSTVFEYFSIVFLFAFIETETKRSVRNTKRERMR